ncbi:MAG: ABC transporter substrate-binding protein [Chloroflexi bacterium]|nr:ABC transporter substrate-binding protein [Chloroflexota bacterium]
MRKTTLAIAIFFLASIVALAGACTAAPTPTPTKAPAPTQAPVATVAPAVATKPAAAAATAAPAVATKAPAVATQAVAPAPAKVAVQPLSPPFKMKVGVAGSAVDAGFYIPYEKGYYKELGLDVELVNFANGLLVVPPLGTGQLDAGGGGVNVALFNMILRGIPLKIVADKSHAEPGNMGIGFLLRKDLLDSGAVKTPADLKGRVLSLPSRGSTQEHMAEILLAQGGLTLDDMDMKMLQVPDQIAAFANKSIDIGHAFEPTVTTAKEMGVAVLWKGDHELLPYREGSAILYSANFQKQTEAAKRFMIAYIKGVRDYNDAFFKKKGTEEVIAIMAKHSTQKDPNVLRKLAAQAINPDGYAYPEALQGDIDYFVRTGQMTPLDIKQVIDHQYVDYALQVLGKYPK